MVLPVLRHEFAPMSKISAPAANLTNHFNINCSEKQGKTITQTNTRKLDSFAQQLIYSNTQAHTLLSGLI